MKSNTSSLCAIEISKGAQVFQVRQQADSLQNNTKTFGPVTEDSTHRYDLWWWWEKLPVEINELVQTNERWPIVDTKTTGMGRRADLEVLCVWIVDERQDETAGNIDALTHQEQTLKFSKNGSNSLTKNTQQPPTVKSRTDMVKQISDKPISLFIRCTDKHR